MPFDFKSSVVGTAVNCENDYEYVPEMTTRNLRHILYFYGGKIERYYQKE
jgi:hypothetical protein